MNPENRYIDLLNIDDEAAVLQVIKKLASQLSDHEHLIRSCIFDLHAAVETDLRRIFFLHFQPLLFLTSDEVENRGVKQQFEKMIDRLSFMDMWRILSPVMTPWYAEFKYIEDINKTRNQASHSKIGKVKYKDRSPFNEPDCLCQMYFDVWAIKQAMPKFFGKIRQPYYQARAYYNKYGDIGIPQEIIQAVDSWYDED